MKYSVLVTVLVSLAVGSVHAATLTPKRGVSILYINGQSAESKMGENQIKEGFNQVLVRMDKDMSRGSNSDVFTSKPYAVSFTFTGDNVVINHPVARSISEANKAFEQKNPNWELTVDGNAIDYEQTVLKGKGGFLPFSGLEKRLAEYNKERGIYFSNGQLVDKPAEALTVGAATTTVVATTDTLAKASEETPVTQVVETTKSMNVEQLKAWYLKASKAERKEFRKWMIDQE